MSAVQVFMDDAAIPASAFSGTQWEHQTAQTAKAESLGGTLSICHAGSPTSGFSLPPSLTFFFAGANVLIYGTLTKGLVASYSIDFGPSQPMIFATGPIGKPNVELWRSTGLASAYHTLQIMPTAGNLTIDYLTYTPTSLTLLDGNDLIFDDQHPALKYSTGWVSTSNTQYPQGAPYLGTTTGTTIVGSSMQLNFTGEFVGVYGALQQVPGILTVLFSVDNAEPTVYTLWDGTQTNSSAWFVSFSMFHLLVPAGSHTLRVTLQEATDSQFLWLDSVITEASFATTLSNAAGGSGSASIPPIIPTPTPTPSSRNGLSGGAIGGITGGVSVFVIIAFFLLRLYLRTRRNSNPKADPPLMAEVPVAPTTPAQSPAPPMPDTPSPPPTAHTHSGPSLHEALRYVFAQQQDAPPVSLQTHWDTDGISNNPTQPSHQGSASNLRSREHHVEEV